jgi:uncharacterized protein YjiS (DUF1127 family)
MSGISVPAVGKAAGATAEAFIGVKREAEPAGSTMLRRGVRIGTIARGVIAGIARDVRLRREAEALSRLDDHTLRDIGLDPAETLYGVRFRRPPADGLP